MAQPARGHHLSKTPALSHRQSQGDTEQTTRTPGIAGNHAGPDVGRSSTVSPPTNVRQFPEGFHNLRPTTSTTTPIACVDRPRRVPYPARPAATQVMGPPTLTTEGVTAPSPAVRRRAGQRPRAEGRVRRRGRQWGTAEHIQLLQAAAGRGGESVAGQRRCQSCGP